MNKIFLIGHLGADPTLRPAANGHPCAHFNLATDEYWRDVNGRQKRTEWHSVFFFGPLAESVPKYLRKGSKVLVEGRLESREDKHTPGQPLRVWSIKGLVYELLDRRGDDASASAASESQGADHDASTEDIPL